MKRKIAITLIAAGLLLSAALAAHAATRYVSDRLVITLRTGAGTEFKIIDYLEAGDKVDVLSDEGDYAKVRTEKGKEGWVQKRYLTSEPPKAEVIAGLQKEIESLKALSGDAAELIKERDSLKAENESLATENRKLRSESDRTERKELIYWFLAGAGVLFLGWLIGRASRQRRFY